MIKNSCISPPRYLYLSNDFQDCQDMHLRKNQNPRDLHYKYRSIIITATFKSFFYKIISQGVTNLSTKNSRFDFELY